MWMHKQTNRPTDVENVKQPLDQAGIHETHAWLVKIASLSQSVVSLQHFTAVEVRMVADSVVKSHVCFSVHIL